MQNIIDIIRAETGSPFGFCSFYEVADHLLDCRAKTRIPYNAKSIISFAFPYKVEDAAPKNISRYAAVPDYHGVCAKELEKIVERLRKEYPQNQFIYFIDNSPIPEVWTAARAGLGVIGKNGLLITEEYGSFVFLGEIVTDLALPYTDKNVSYCADCGKCKKACPVALCKEGCLSAVTQQKKELSEEQKRLISENGSVWGCDICQNACPHNAASAKTENREFLEGYRDRYSPNEDIAGRAYAWRGEGVILRNALLFDDVAQVVAADASADEA